MPSPAVDHLSSERASSPVPTPEERAHLASCDQRLASHLARMLVRLSGAERDRALGERSALLRLKIWSEGALPPPPVPTIARELEALGAEIPGLGEDLARIADRLGSAELHALALDRPGAPLVSLLAVLDQGRLPEGHVRRLAEDPQVLSMLLHRAIERGEGPLLALCSELAEGHTDSQEIVANLLYASMTAGRPSDAMRIARERVARHRQEGGGRMLATLYVNILLTWGSTGSSDDLSREIVLELEEILEQDPGWFGADGGGRAGRDLLGPAFGAAATGRALLGDGEASARWLEQARRHRWPELALYANQVCFQNLGSDPHLGPILARIGREEAERLARSGDPRSRFSLALTLHNASDLDGAERAYHQVLEQLPRHGDSLNNLGNLFGVRGDLPSALEWYDQALSVAPTHPIYLSCKAWALARSGRYREASALADRAIALAPSQPHSWFVRGAAWLGMGDRGRAASDFRRGAALNPGWRQSERGDPWFGEVVASVDG